MRDKMASISVIKVTTAEVEKLLSLQEGHFCDLKAIEIAPSKLTRSISAFSNAEGGELFIGVDEDKQTGEHSWRGFAKQEDANGHIQAFERLFPLSAKYLYDILTNEDESGLILKIQAAKTRDIKTASNNTVYIRRGAQNVPVDTEERLEILKRDKGLTSFENESVNCDPTLVTNSEQIIWFMLDVVPTSEPEPWLRKQMILTDSKPTVAGVVLFADEPQALLPKRCGIKVYRYKTTENEGTREALAFDPISIEGSAYSQIKNAVRLTQEIIESVRIRTSQK